MPPKAKNTDDVTRKNPCVFLEAQKEMINTDTNDEGLNYFCLKSSNLLAIFDARF